MYWDNPIIEVNWPSGKDPIVESFHNGTHCLFYDPCVVKSRIAATQTLQDLCNWANKLIQEQTLTGFLADARNYYDIANLVKLNIWVTDLKKQGNVKPMLLYYEGNPQFTAGTGESRMRALERVPEIQTVSGFITTRSENYNLFSDLEPVTTFDQFARLCHATEDQQFLFRLTDNQAQYGIYWYEYNSDNTVNVTPGQDYCVEVFTNYLTTNHVHFTPEWFDLLVPWDNYKKSV